MDVFMSLVEQLDLSKREIPVKSAGGMPKQGDVFRDAYDRTWKVETVKSNGDIVLRSFEYDKNPTEEMQGDYVYRVVNVDDLDDLEFTFVTAKL